MLTSHCKETKQPHKKIKVDWFFFGGGAYIPIYPPSLRPCNCLNILGVVKNLLRAVIISTFYPYFVQIRVHNTAESLYKAVGMEVLPDEYLPDDYTGPSAGPLQQIIRT